MFYQFDEVITIVHVELSGTIKMLATRVQKTWLVKSYHVNEKCLE